MGLTANFLASFAIAPLIVLSAPSAFITRPLISVKSLETGIEISFVSPLEAFNTRITLLLLSSNLPLSSSEPFANTKLCSLPSLPVYVSLFVAGS